MKFLFALIIGAFALLATVFWIWCIVDIVRGQFKSDTDKLIWLILVLLMPFIGTILYVTFGRSNRMNAYEEYV